MSSCWQRDERQPRKFPSGSELTPAELLAGVKKEAGDWKFDAMTIGYPGPVVHGQPVAEPFNLGPGWVGFDFEAGFGCPVKLINDAAMQALGSYEGGRMLFLGLGTGLGSAMVVDGVVEPMELAHLPYKKGTFEDYIGMRGLKKLGKKRWRQERRGGCRTAAAAPSSPPTSCSAAATSRSSRSCRRRPRPAATPTPSGEAFACGPRKKAATPKSHARHRARMGMY